MESFDYQYVWRLFGADPFEDGAAREAWFEAAWGVYVRGAQAARD